jgi:hypothetical protein
MEYEINHDAMIAEQAELWNTRFGKPESAPNQNPMADFNNRIRETQRIETETREPGVVFVAGTVIPDPNKTEYFFDPYEATPTPPSWVK